MSALVALLERPLQSGSLRLQSPGMDWDEKALSAAARALEKTLVDHNVVSGEPVLVSVSNQVSDLAQFLAVWRLGGVAVPVHATSPGEVVSNLRARIGARLLLKPEGAVLMSAERAAPREELRGAALLMFTSGSTGGPKGVVISGERFAAKLEVLVKFLGFRSGDTVLVPLQTHFIFGLWVALITMMAGARLVLMPKFSVAAVHDGLSAGATVIGVVPTMLRALVAEQGSSPSAGLRAILTGGEPYSAALARQVAEKFPQAGVYDLFGSTEMGSCDFCLTPADAPQGWGSIGRPTPNVEFRIEPDSTLPAGAGELQIKTPYAMLGYFDNSQANAAAWSGDYFRTGDMARVRADGYVELIGRRKDIISRGGTKISPLEMDALFAAHPKIEAALATGLADERLGQTLHMLVVARANEHVDADELRAWAASRIERYKLPDAIHLVRELPLGRTGKADRNAAAALIAKIK